MQALDCLQIAESKAASEAVNVIGNARRDLNFERNSAASDAGGAAQPDEFD
jgi:hypothetical protein